ncbi:uncharacterized protein LOC6526977 [Drosophila yakuba]|uniref:Uncharacterized protein n=1 Tax=Drosophila yakuba TaxID=7245 RepID=B4NZV8_DROYA|nr:uncharacterized protein LOC6526977 [Drosophila yakuba]XP_039226923.1 uncharacterized protein LOC6526977 [Drosophila yakuba]EDW87785.2 uncharacterized protein Dyak_GE18377 [Drosophila yakuba]
MNLVMCNLVLAFIAIAALKTTLAYSSFSTDNININYFDARNSTLPMTTTHPHTNRPLGRYILPPRDNEQSSDYDQYSEVSAAIQRDRSYLIRLIRRRVPRDQAPQQVILQGRSLSGLHWGQGDDNHLDSDAGGDGSDDYPSDQPVNYTTLKGRIAEQNSVKELRKYNITRTRELNKMIEAHLQLMAREGICKVPRPEVVHITRETNTVYSPRATILHRCSDKVGCCEAGWTCQMKRNETVERVFAKVHGRYSEPFVVPMENHTECGCVKVETRRKRSPICLCPKHFKDFSWTGSQEEHQHLELHLGERREQRCRCDCHLSDDTCKRLKNGVEGFSVMERRRIQSGEVSPPFCNYGAYDVRNGRCPRPGLPNRNPNLQPYFQARRQHGKS